MGELGFHLPSLLVYLVNFGLLLALLYFFAYKRILALLDQRSGRIRESLEEAELARQEAAKAREEMGDQLAEARREGQQMLEQARQAAERFREEERERARQEAENLLERARQEIQQERNAAIEDVRRHFGDLAITAAERVVERSLDRSAHHDLIEKVLEEGFEPSRE